MSENLIVWLMGSAVAIIVWAVRVESKVAAHEREIAQLRSDTQMSITLVRDDVRYIRQRIDEVLDHPQR